MIPFEQTLRAIHGDTAVDAYIAAEKVKQDARDAIALEAGKRHEQAWNAQRDAYAAAGDWMMVDAMDNA